ncbi:hypothetical protein M422DRAFT_23985 [Sphaerobolus stellatus SS14]|nr:hypothetical protein M422DRAFT_23985 [Sphaerobolus stellatus SS14]
MDTDWCLGCDRQTTTDGQAYCSKTCMLVDQSSLARSYPFPSYSRVNFDVPHPPAPRRSSTNQSHRRQQRSRASEPIYNVARFRDEELEAHAEAIVLHNWSGKDREGILRWARAVQPGLEEEVSPAPYMDVQTPAVAELQRVLYRSSPFPLTAQNLAPPCVTVESRHPILLSSLHAHLEDRTAASQSQDDASLLTPATESVAAPSIAEATKPLLGRIVHRMRSWMASPTQVRGSPECIPSPPSEDSAVGHHSDETQRVQGFLYRKSSAVNMPSTPIRRRDFSVESFVSDAA